MYGKKEIRELLEEKQIAYEWQDHPALFTMQDIAVYGIAHAEDIAKNVFASDDKRRTYFLISVKGDERVNLKAIGQEWGYSHLRFASAEEMQKMLGLAPGSVSPLGLLNDEEHKIKFYLDRRYEGKNIVVHPNENTACVFLKTGDLLSLIKEGGNEVYYFSQQ